MASTPSPSPDRIRLTISVSPETHATFQRLAGASNMSIGRAMGDWLADTMDAAEHAAELMEKARAAPKEVMRQVHAYALGLADETGALLEQVRARSATQAPTASGARSAPAAPVPPRPVIRGGKSPGKTLSPRGGKGRG
jgi:hypothetical protein